jgi:hypothetical protein
MPIHTIWILIGVLGYILGVIVILVGAKIINNNPKLSSIRTVTRKEAILVSLLSWGLFVYLILENLWYLLRDLWTAFDWDKPF